MYKIDIKGLTFSACHGVNPEEKTAEQPFRVNVKAIADGHAENDNIESTVSYANIAKTVKAVMEGGHAELIETLAERIAAKILGGYEKIRETEVEVEKPEAPLSIPFQNVSVSIKRKWSRAFISVGSNLGDRKGFLDLGLKMLREKDGIRVLKTAAYTETEPYGKPDQPTFLNGLIEIETYLDPFELLDFLHVIERAAGRERIERWGARTLDMDIVLFDDLVIYSDSLIIPHADMCNRKFVLAPLAELAPDFIHPVEKKNIKQLLKRLI